MSANKDKGAQPFLLEDEDDENIETVMESQDVTAVDRLKQQAESHPWAGLSYVLSTVQFMVITLDLFMNTSLSKTSHYSITGIEFATALLLVGYQNFRLGCMLLWCHEHSHSYFNKATVFLLVSGLPQIAILACSIYSFFENSDPVEWAMFGIGIVWGLVYPTTFGTVEQVMSDLEAGNNDNVSPRRKKKLGPLSAVYSIFRHHFVQAPLLAFVAILLATVHAILSTYQGATINELTKAVTKTNANGDLKASAGRVKELTTTLLGIWAASNASKFLFDLLSAVMFARLEIWLRQAILERAVTEASSGISDEESGGNDDNLAKYQTIYASDITGVTGLYIALMKGVLVNLLLIVTAFVFLAMEEWRIACVTLGFLAMAVTSGPTSLAGSSAGETQRLITSGISLFAAATKTGNEQDPEKGQSQPQSSSSAEHIQQQHQEQVLKPLQSSLFRRTFFTGSVETFISFYSSFLTAIVVITMSWEVYNKDMDSSDFLGIFFVFKQLQKAATKLSGIIKKLVKQTASVQRVNDVVLETKKNA